METLGRYRLTEEIGRGGMAVVYGGYAEGEQGFRKPVVVKRIHPHLTRRDTFVQMLVREAKLTVRLDHPNVVQVLELGRSGDDYFLVLERVDGCDLSQLLAAADAAGITLPPRLAGHLVREVLAALHHAHQARDEDGRPLGIVHRDVSPSNVLVGKDGRVRLTDFGVARTTLHESTTGLKGKLAYMSPEQAVGEPVEPPCDLYAAGLVLVELLTGERPLEGGGEIEMLEAARTGALERIRRDAIPADFRPVVERALAPLPADRHLDAEQMRAALAPLSLELEAGRERVAELVALLQPVGAASLGSGDLETATPPQRTQRVETVVTRVTVVPPETLEGKRKRGWLWWALAALVLLVASIGLWASGVLQTDPGDGVEDRADETAQLEVEPIAEPVEPETPAELEEPPVREQPTVAPPPAEEPPQVTEAPEAVVPTGGSGHLSVLVGDVTGFVTSDIPGWTPEHAPFHRRPVPAGEWTLYIVNEELGLSWQGQVTVEDGKDVGLRLSPTEDGWESWVKTPEDP